MRAISCRERESEPNRHPRRKSRIHGLPQLLRGNRLLEILACAQTQRFNMGAHVGVLCDHKARIPVPKVVQSFEHFAGFEQRSALVDNHKIKTFVLQ